MIPCSSAPARPRPFMPSSWNGSSTRPLALFSTTPPSSSKRAKVPQPRSPGLAGAAPPFSARRPRGFGLRFPRFLRGCLAGRPRAAALVAERDAARLVRRGPQEDEAHLVGRLLAEEHRQRQPALVRRGLA